MEESQRIAEQYCNWMTSELAKCGFVVIPNRPPHGPSQLPIVHLTGGTIGYFFELCTTLMMRSSQIRALSFAINNQDSEPTIIYTGESDSFERLKLTIQDEFVKVKGKNLRLDFFEVKVSEMPVGSRGPQYTPRMAPPTW